ncbi:MAG TPA: amidohydrolase family protein [Methanocorpusculum sp.]|nr:amidohydrolase family protein [Methanocorpusculum sp.]
MGHEEIYSGLAFTGRELLPESVDIAVNNGRITEITQAAGAPKHIIIPKFFNAHTHLADTVAMDLPVDRSLAELVAPPNGLKHRILAQTKDSDLVSAMRGSIEFMKMSGTAGFADFREGGTHGVSLLEEAARGSGMEAVILGRDGGECAADGCGLSSAHGTEEEARLRDKVKKAGGIFAVHAGEKGTDDIEDAFALEPDFIVHATRFRPQDIRQTADMQIPVVVCPRSNWQLHVACGPQTPPIRELLDAGCKVYLGTDNCMFVSPDMCAECAFVHTVYNLKSEEILRAAVCGAELSSGQWAIEKGNPARFSVLDIGYAKTWSKDIIASVFSRRAVQIR